jgi:hypothetical protein
MQYKKLGFNWLFKGYCPQQGLFIILILALFLPTSIRAFGGESYITTTKGKDCFSLSAGGKSTTLFISSNDYAGVIRALKDLKTDIGKVTSIEPTIVYDNIPSQKEVVIVGTLGKSPVIDQLVKSGKLDVTGYQWKVGELSDSGGKKAITRY